MVTRIALAHVVGVGRVLGARDARFKKTKKAKKTLAPKNMNLNSTIYFWHLNH